MKNLNKITLVLACLQAMSLSAFAQESVGDQPTTDVQVEAQAPAPAPAEAPIANEAPAPASAAPTDEIKLPAAPAPKAQESAVVKALKKEAATIRLKEANIGAAYALSTGGGAQIGATLASENLELRQDYRIGASTTGTVLPYAKIELSRPGGIAGPNGRLRPQPISITDKIDRDENGEPIKHNATFTDKVTFLHDTGMRVGWQFSVARELAIPVSEAVTLKAFGEAGVRQSQNWFVLPFAQAGGKALMVDCPIKKGNNLFCTKLSFGAAAGLPQFQANFEAGAEYTHKFDQEKSAVKSLTAGAQTSVLVQSDAVDGAKGTGVISAGIGGTFR